MYNHTKYQMHFPYLQQNQQKSCKTMSPLDKRDVTQSIVAVDTWVELEMRLYTIVPE